MKDQTSAHYFAATSVAPLVEVCNHLERVFATAPFDLDSHAHWEYGAASADELSFNITRCSDSETIETWIKGTPHGVNYQAIVWCSDSQQDAILAKFAAELASVLECSPEHFRSSPGSRPAGPAGESTAASAAPPSSGFSLPFTWFLAVGLAAVGVLIVRSCPT